MVELLAVAAQGSLTLRRDSRADGRDGSDRLLDVERRSRHHRAVIVVWRGSQIKDVQHEDDCMDRMFIGVGTVANVATVLIGSALGLWLGDRLREGTRTLVTQILGLFTFLIAGLSMTRIMSADLSNAVAGSAMLIILGSLLVGALLGSWMRLEDRLDNVAGWLQSRMRAGSGDVDKQRFVTGFVTATIVFCVGPLTILGSLSDGLGLGADQLLMKAVMDGFASIAFASSLGVGVMASALAVGVIQGSLTLLGLLLGNVLSTASVDALTVTGGVVLLALGFRLLDVVRIKVADMLPALLVAPAATWVVSVVVAGGTG